MPSSGAESRRVRPVFCVDRYAVYDEFAAGGMATLHLARLNGAHGFRRTVAVKRLLPHLLRDREFALMLIDEARLASRVRHPNVVSTLDVVETREELLLVMDYVHGDSLAKLLQWSTTGMPIAIASAVLADALHGLHAAHEAKDTQGQPLNLVHRDVSPQNILVGLDGVTRIVDFGIAKAAGRAQTTQEGAVKGKLSYMAPEQLGQGEITRVTDVFAASIVLWELLTGARLFAGRNQAEVVFKVMSAPIPRPSTLRPELPPALEEVVMRGLQRDAAERFASAREMALALEAASPSVRPSEIATWVEGAVGERLVPRARLVHAIERAEEGDEAAASDDARAAASSHDTAPSDAAPVASERHHIARRSTKLAALTAAFAALVALLWIVRAEGARHEGTPTSARAATPAQVVESLPIVERPPAAAAPLQEVVDASAPRAKVRAPRAARRSCDPPYSIDSAGRVLFKEECME